MVIASQAEQAHGAIPKAQLTQQLHKAEDKDPEESCDMLSAAETENFTNQLAVGELEFNLLATTGETAGNITGKRNQSPREEWPSWSLPPPPPSWSIPPPEENLRKENVKKNNPEGNNAVNDSTVGEATESGFFSVEDNSNNNSRVPSNIQSSSAAVTTTPSRPITPEAPRSPQNPLVTGLNRSCQSNAVAGAHSSVNHEPDSNNSDQGSGNPAEHDDTEYRVLLTELQYKVIHHWQVISFCAAGSVA